MRALSPFLTLLLVGDPHVTVSELPDCQALMGYVLEIAGQEKASVLLLGDQHHNHSLLNLEVISFWKEFFSRAAGQGTEVAALVGNHDMPSDGRCWPHAMMVHEDQCAVVDRPKKLMDRVLAVPYTADEAEFLRACNLYPETDLLICHHTFDGSRYESGFYAKGATNPNLVPQKMIISGHIHAPQEFGKVWYPGAPRWRTAADANTDRAIWLLKFGEDGTLLSKRAFPTDGVCRVIRHLRVTPETLLPKYMNPKDDWRLDLEGPAAWCEEEARHLGGLGFRIRTFPDAAVPESVRESDGVQAAFGKWLLASEPRRGTSRERVAEMARERLGNVCRA